jgi:hypothetical protein
MGGPGSGVRWDKKGAVESYQCLDVRVLHRTHRITPENEITMNYERRGEQVTQKIFLDWTSCNYGGYRPWLICMDCGRKVAKIYFGGKIFACRHCLDLTYRSCQESDSRVSKFLRNYDGFGAPEDLPLFALNRLWGRIRKERDRLQKEMSRRRRGRPPKKASEE